MVNPASANLMRSVAPSGVISRRAGQFKALGFLVIALAIFVLAIGLLLLVIPMSAPGTTGYNLYLVARTIVLIVGVLLLIGGIVLLIRAFTWKTDNDLAQAAARVLGGTLDSRYTFIRNVSNTHIAWNNYIDAILVGPSGVLVFRLLNETGLWINDGRNWLTLDREGQSIPARFNPTQQAQDDIDKLRAFFVRNRMSDVPIFGAIVYLPEPPAAQLQARNPAIPIAHLSTLIDALRPNYLAEERIDQTRVQQIVKLLYRSE